MIKATERGTTCVRTLVFGTAMGAFYPLIVAGLYMGLESLPLAIASVYWGLIKAILAYAVLCLYQLNGLKKYAFVSILLFASAVFSIHPVAYFLTMATEALALTGLSLVIFDLGRSRPASNLQLAGGLIFLGVVLSVLNAPAVEFAASVALLFGLLLTATRLMRI